MRKHRPEPEIEISDIELPEIAELELDVPDFDFSDGVEAERESDFETASKEAVEKLDNDFTRDAKREASRFQDNTDTEFWAAIYFQSRAQKEAFLKAIGVDTEEEDKYIDGNKLAKTMGIELPPSPKRAARRGTSQDLLDLVID